MDGKIELSRKKAIILVIFSFMCLTLGFYLKHSAYLPEEDEKQVLSNLEDPHESNESDSLYSNTQRSYLTYNAINNDATNELVDFDSSQVPTYVDGANLSGNIEWVSHYAACRRCSAFSIPNSINTTYNLNYFEVNDALYKLPLLEDEFFLERGIELYSLENYTEYFQGSAYGVVDQDLSIIWGNKIYLQNYPGTPVINAVHIDAEHLLASDSSVQATISGISLGMSENEVIEKYGSGVGSSRSFSTEMVERTGITNFEDTIYKNSSGILVVSYDENSYVISITLYSSGLNQNK